MLIGQSGADRCQHPVVIDLIVRDRITVGLQIHPGHSAYCDTGTLLGVHHNPRSDDSAAVDHDYDAADLATCYPVNVSATFRTSGAPLASALSLAGAIASQTVVFGAVLYYFGLVYARAWYGYFGIDVGMLGFSTADYTLRSLIPTFWPVVIGLLVVMGLVSARGLPLVIAMRTHRPRRTLRRWYWATLSMGAVFAVVPGSVWLLAPTVGSPWTTYLPGFLVAGAVLLGYATSLRANYPVLIGSSRSVRRNTPRSATATVLVALLALGFAGCFWGIGTYAGRRGTADASGLAQAGFPGQPSILLLSTDRLAIEGTGAQVGEITTQGEKFHYAYSGLRLLARTSDTYFLIPQEWQATRDRVFVIPRADNLRIDIASTRN
ncbi:hypothetical protein [Nocardia nepalensis]|uniref:hypothetical protein n=1 Tax=Nocardia nepalensis TaxID=3375448 RepID=UPI003B67E186